MNALVLSGGNIKGAYQAGTVSTLLQAGYVPEIATGISVGALNAGYLAGLAPAGSSVDWPAVGRKLEMFWREHVTSPKSFVEKRGIPSVLWNLIRKKWKGLLDTEPLVEVVRRELAAADPRKSVIRLRVGAVNILSGDLVYQDNTEPRLIDYILASTAEPVSMPLQVIDGQPYYDGGLRDIAPLKQAIDLGATRVVCALCQTVGVAPVEPHFNRGDAFHLVSRVGAITSNEIVRNDLETFLEINRQLLIDQSQPMLDDKRYIPILVVRPAQPIPFDVENFSSADIVRMIDQGRGDTIREVKAAQADPMHQGHAIARDLRV
ncbi:MAG: patatin-like phospholipase family protein [Gemmatimonadales bacterium]|nr:patatin-like phospholipase family protein [Gemmatimonadales bacterium]